MLKWTAIALTLAAAAPALADATADATAHSEAFAKACEAGDVQGVLALYADNATVVWPGAGEEAKGKASIEKLATNFCNPKTKPKLVLKSIEGIALDSSHIATVGHWEGTSIGPNGKPVTSQVRTTELLVKSGNAWRYLIDHASIGLPPPPKAAAKSESKAAKKK